MIKAISNWSKQKRREEGKTKITSESAARSRIRFDRDFDPGSLTVPVISLIGCNTISGTFDGFSAVVTEAEIRWEIRERQSRKTLSLLRQPEPENLGSDPNRSEEERGVGSFWVLLPCAGRWPVIRPFAMLACAISSSLWVELDDKWGD